MKQVQSGKALEYGMIVQIEKIINCEIIHNNSLDAARVYYEDSESVERDKISKAAKEAIKFLLSHDSRLRGGDYKAYLQPDEAGKTGDVRDVIIQDVKRNDEIGLSLKNRHRGSKTFAFVIIYRLWKNMARESEY